ncbi:MAG: 3'-5' exonuclease [Bacteroidales bacterium]|jgi:DNA polymerase-3 subunit epsilon|nr:3'-5' exonuclease [Bacteroidales bacterium]MDD7608006.1 3'-5' exonuclease [Bacteroidales bacterium]MDY5459975.1 3'-5' exonuclease [Candidatus Cryptobacteroides sp.]MEE0340988.1 3'-5' exonuclease [Bacteroidales bacterium]
MNLNLTRPLLFFDIESTGLNIPNDSIIELSFVKVFPDGKEEVKTWKIKPWDYEKQCQRPIDPSASKVNGITDDMLVDCPTFYEVADEVADWLKDSDLAGFNSTKFDLPMLAEEFERVELAGKKLNVDLHSPKMVDVQNIYHTMEPRNLKAAYRFYCGGEDFDNAHTAEADTLATYAVLKGQLDKYGDALKNDVNTLSSFGNKKSIDFAGYLIQGDDGDAVINFGKFKGKKARDVYNTERSYFSWIQNGAFMLDTKKQFAKLEQEFAMEKLKTKWGK